EYTEIDLEEYASVKNQGDQSSRAKVQQGYNKVITSYRIAKDIGITYEMRTQNKYPEVVRRLTNLAGLGVNRMDLDLTHRFTFGTATSYTDQDGRTIDTTLGDTLELFSTVHTVRGASTTYRNRLAGNPQYSKSALEGMERLVVEETINQFGQKVVVPFDIIWSSEDPNTVNAILTDLRSMAATDAGLNSGVLNPYKAKYKHVVLPRLATDANGAVDATKRKYWGLASSMASTAHLAIWEEAHLKVPSDLNAGEEFSTDNWEFGVRCGYGVTIVNGVWIKMSSGTGEA
ncbi:hypothetical protein M0R04_09915, partial [Candidatus Dojkabacteria bacterium]|nr:hypothetical protein [Candidatus Dojkabacteria bacterium]